MCPVTRGDPRIAERSAYHLFPAGKPEASPLAALAGACGRMPTAARRKAL
jgi:hypothetical protein